MSKFWDATASVVQVVAPTIASVFGGPAAGALANTALHYIFEQLGVNTEDEAANKIQQASPETIASLRQAEIDFQKFLSDNNIKLETINAEDRKSAREREVAVKDWTPKVLGCLAWTMFVAIIVILFCIPVPEPNKELINLMILLGVVGAWNDVRAYFFGGSPNADAIYKAIPNLLKK